MRIRLSHRDSKHDLIVQSNASGTFRLPAQNWWEWLWRKPVEFEVSKNEIVILRTDAMTEPDGVAVKNHV